MASLKALKIRIASVKSTQKITKAMKMVAAAKLRRAQDAAEAARPYAERMNAVLASLSNDPRASLAAGVFDAGEAIWNLRKVSTTPPPREFLGVTNSDLAFLGNSNACASSGVTRRR